jgi:hypothetical protein
MAAAFAIHGIAIRTVNFKWMGNAQMTFILWRSHQGLMEVFMPFTLRFVRNGSVLVVDVA